MDSVPEITQLHGDTELSGRCPRPTEEFISPWQAATWAAFGTTEVIDCLLLRSFDGGLQQLAHETTKVWKERTDRVRAFDAAEHALFALLATEQISATGCLPRLSPNGTRMMHKSSKCPELIPSHIFRSGNSAFGPSGELQERVTMLDAICDGAKWNGRSGDPSIPLYYEVRIRTADFIAVTNAQQVIRPMTNQTAERATTRTKSGNRFNGLDYRPKDRPLVDKAIVGIGIGTYTNATNAARALVKEAAGQGNDNSRVARLIPQIKKALGDLG